MPSAPRYWAFISYSSRDRAWARWLQRALETYALPARLVGHATPVGPAPRRLRPVFRDRTELAAQHDLAAGVQAALQASAFLIVVCSPDAARSRWVGEEIRRFRALHGDARILSVIVAGSVTAAGDDCFHAALRDRDPGEGDGVRGVPVAADLRPGGDGRRLTLLKLVAGMLGVGLDELVRRDAQRRQRQMALVTGGALAGMALTGALALAAVRGRDEAIRQKAKAEHERVQADRLVAFMLDDLHKRIQPTGRLDLMDGIARQALAYYAAQDPSDLDAGSLEKRSAAITLLGASEIQRGHLDEAARAFAAARTTTAELLARAPNDGQRVFAHAQSVFWVGEVARQRGEMAEAEDGFRAYLALARRLPALDPANDDWRGEVDSAWSDLGTLYLQLGRADEAFNAFTQSLAVSAALAERHPEDLDRQMDLAQCHAWLADALEMQGRVAESREQRRLERVIYRLILDRDPGFAQAEFSDLVSQRAVADLDLAAGDTAAAEVGYAKAAARAARLSGRQPDNMNTAAVAGLTQVGLGEALLASGRLADARAALARAEGPLAAALAKSGAVAAWRRYAEQERLLEAALALKGGDAAAALRIDRAVLADATAAGRAAANSYAVWIVDQARLQAGEDLAKLGRPGEARTLWSAVASDLSTPVRTREPRLRAVLARAEGHLGRGGGAPGP